MFRASIVGVVWTNFRSFARTLRFSIHFLEFCVASYVEHVWPLSRSGLEDETAIRLTPCWKIGESDLYELHLRCMDLKLCLTKSRNFIMVKMFALGFLKHSHLNRTAVK